MLSPDEQKIIEENMKLILVHPSAITLSSFMTTYNTIYRHCSMPSEVYYIKGEEIYRIIEEQIAAYTRSLVFKASIENMTEQVTLFRQSLVLLSRIYSYIERFYIRTSMYKNSQVEKLADMFYNQLYYNYLFAIEDSLVGLVFLEIETARELFRQECASLKSIVSFYTETLLATGQEEKLRKFHKAYLSNFLENTNFKLETGRLLKQIYLEMYFATNIIGEKGMCRDIVNMLDERREDMFQYVFAKMEAFEGYRHVFKIISMMDDSAKMRFKKAYCAFVGRKLRQSSSFEELYMAYCQLRRQIIINKMGGYMESLESAVREDFIDRGSAIQEAIGLSLVAVVGKLALQEKFTGGRMCARDARGPQNTESEAGACAKHADEPSGACKEPRCTDSPDEKAVQNYLENTEIILDFLALIYNDFLADAFIQECQMRLLQGESPAEEKAILGKMVERMGISSVSKLKNIISTYLSYNTEYFGLPTGGQFRVSLLKHTMGFWNIRGHEIGLEPTLGMVKDRIIEMEGLAYKECVFVNYTLSPIVFEMNGTWYKMNSDVFSILFHVHGGADMSGVKIDSSNSVGANADAGMGNINAGNTNADGINIDTINSSNTYNATSQLNPATNNEYAADNLMARKRLGIKVEVLRKIANDQNFDRNYKRLVENGFLIEEQGITRLVNRKDCRKYVDLFVIQDIFIKNEKRTSPENQKSAIIEAQLCRFLKRVKEAEKESLVGSGSCTRENGLLREITREDIEDGIARLVEKGYLSEEDGLVKYIP